MGKSKRIAIGGWLSSALSIMTRGWFGGAPLVALSNNVTFVEFRDKRGVIERELTMTPIEFVARYVTVGFRDKRLLAGFRDKRGVSSDD